MKKHKEMFNPQRESFNYIESNKIPVWLHKLALNTMEKEVSIYLQEKFIPFVERRWTCTEQKHRPCKVVLLPDVPLTVCIHPEEGKEIEITLYSIICSSSSHRNIDREYVTMKNLYVTLYKFFEEWEEFIEELWKYKPKL